MESYTGKSQVYGRSESAYSEWERQRRGYSQEDWDAIEQTSVQHDVDLGIAESIWKSRDRKESDTWTTYTGEKAITTYDGQIPNGYDLDDVEWGDGGVDPETGEVWNTFIIKDKPEPVHYYSPPPPPPAKPKEPNVSVPQPPTPPGPLPEFTLERQTEVSKYEYLMGIRDLQMKGKQFEPKSIFVSKPIPVSGNIIEVSLEAEEKHPLFDNLSGEASSRQTSVEYYVAYEENPSLDEWHPILPEDQKTVTCELLIFDTARTATLRFPALTYGNTEAVVYKDGKRLEDQDWAFVDGGTRIQLFSEFASSSVYTIDYVPNAEIMNPWIVSVDHSEAKRIKTTEVFKEGTNHNKTITLSNYPYVDYEKINLDGSYDPNTSEYHPIKVSLQNANIAGPNRTIIKSVEPYQEGTTQEAFTYNITDYKTEEWKSPRSYSLRADDLYKGFQYVHEGNQLIFSETFNKANIMENMETNHGNAEIVVEYEYLVSNFRIKMILRRNSTGENSISPSVHSYALKFKAMK